MQIVIDIPEFMYNDLKDKEQFINLCGNRYKIAILNGTPLPKGHGRLIDIGDIEWAKYHVEKNYMDYECIDWDDINNAPTIIEADEEDEE